jgi:LysM repeat protein
MFDDPTRRTARLEIDPGTRASTPPPVAGDPARATEVDATDEAAAEMAAAAARTDLVGGPDGYPTSSGVGGNAGSSSDSDASAGDDGSGNLPPWIRGRPRVPMDAGAPASLGPQTRPGARPAGPREWEGARRFEAYAAGSGTSRLRRPALIATAAVLVAVAVLVVFLLPSVFLSTGAAPTATPGTSTLPGAAATHKPKPTATAPGATPVRPLATPQSYRVKRGDTLLRIARRFNVTVDQLTCANDIRNPDSLSVGATLTIPIESYECPRPTKKPK